MKASLRQLEAFYQIVLHEGIANAARALRVDPSTLNAHLLELERILGVILIIRPGFKLTPAGEILAAAVERSRDIITAACDKISGDAQAGLRFVASELVAQHFLPDVIAELERRHPGVRCSTDNGSEAHMQAQLRAEAVDVAIAPAGSPPSDGGCAPLVELPVVLLAPAASKVRSAAELWANGTVAETLFFSGSSDTLLRQFDAALRGLHVKWPDRRRVSSLASVATEVVAGRGFGLAVDVAELVRKPRIRVLSLPGFPPLAMVAYWRGRERPEIMTAIELLRLIVRKLK